MQAPQATQAATDNGGAAANAGAARPLLGRQPSGTAHNTHTAWGADCALRSLSPPACSSQAYVSRGVGGMVGGWERLC